MKKRGNPFLYIGGAISAVMSGLIIMGYFWTPYDPTAFVEKKFLPPSAAHLLGTDNFGRDIFSRVIDGAGTSFFIAVCVVAIGCVAGGAGIVLTGILEKPAQAEIVWLLSLVTGCIACVCLLVIGYGRLKGRKPHYLLHCAVTVYFVVHLVSKYRSWSSEPQLQVFFFPLLAGVFLTLAAYQRTCLDAGQGSRKYYGFQSNNRHHL